MLNKFKKGVSLLEALVAMFVMSMIILAYMSSSDTFVRSQQNLINLDRRDQIAEVILQGIMEYRKNKFDYYGTATVNGAQTMVGNTDEITIILTQYAADDPSTILTGSDVVPPEPGDVFLIGGIKGKHIIDSISPASGARIYTITTDKPITAGTLSDGDSVSFIAFHKNELECFGVKSQALSIMNLMNAPSTSLGDDCPTVPQEVQDLHTYWKNMITSELPNVTIAKIEIQDDNLGVDVLIRVILGDADKQTVQAKKINNCIFQNTPSTLAFQFPGMDEPIITGIMEGSESPVVHYNLNGIIRKYTGANSQPAGGVSVADLASCNKVSASTCRQNYADEDTFTVFMYRYQGTDAIAWRPSSCSSSKNWQCPEVIIREGDLSLWFIFDHFNDSNDGSGGDDKADYGINGAMAGNNGYGQLSFRTTNLPDGARILVFDDASESCQSAITSDGTCSGVYKWGNKHDGMVIHLATKDANSLADIQLEILKVPSDVNQWRVLKTSAECTLASGEASTAHGDQYFREQDDTPIASPCWTYIGEDSDDEIKNQLRTKLSSGMNLNSDSINVLDSSIFGQTGFVQINNEEIEFFANDTVNNILSGTTANPLVRGAQRYEVRLNTAITSTSSTGKIIADSNPGIAYYGGYIKIDNEVMRVKFASFDDFAANKLTIKQRGVGATNGATHSVNALILNNDVKKTVHNSQDEVWALTDGNDIATAMDTGDGNSAPANAVYPRRVMKKSISLNLSSANICQ